MKNLFVLILAASLSFAVQARAELLAPDVLVRETAQDVLAIVKQDKDIQSGNMKKVLELVEIKVLPHFDFERMTKLTAGRAWRTATAEQRQALVVEFRTLLVRTYTNAFTSYRDQSVDVKPLKIAAGDDEVLVKTLIFKPGAQGQSIAVDYLMEKTADGWKAFDLSVEGASLIATYRSTFAEQIQRAGFDGLIKTLAEKNSANAKEPLRKVDSK